MRLLSVGSLPPEWGGRRRGGVATFHASLLDGLLSSPSCGIEPIAVVVSDAPAGPAPLPLHAPADGQSRREFLAEVLALTRPDVVLLHHFATQNGLLLPDLAPELPLVGIAHSWHMLVLVSDEQVESGRRRVVQTMAGLRAIAFGSEHCRQEGLRLGLEYPQTQAMIHYPLSGAFAAALDVGGPRDGVVFLGSLLPHKQAPALVQAMTELAQCPLTVIGRGPEEALLRAAIGRLGLTDRVSLELDIPGPEASPRLRQRLAAAEVMCLPSRSESFGLAYIESLACGTPVVGYSPTVTEIAAAMEMEIGVPLHDGSPAEIAAAIGLVRAQPWDHDELRARTLQVFSVDRVTQRYAELLTAVAGPL